MATIGVDRGDILVHLNPLEKLGAMRGDIRVSRQFVMGIRVSDEPWSELRGMRAPGVGLPGLIALGSRRGGGTHDFAAIYRRGPAVVVDLAGTSFDRLVISSREAAADATRLAAS